MTRVRPVAWVVGFARFWYHFIVGDDWTLALAVAVGLAVTALLKARDVIVWWLVPAVVVVMVAVSLKRASRAR